MSTHDVDASNRQEQDDEWSVPTDAMTEHEREASEDPGEKDASLASVERPVRDRSENLFDSERARKAGEKSGAARRARAAIREEEAASDREKLARALGKVPQATWDAVIAKIFNDATEGTAAERRGSVLALCRLLDQAYGRAQPEAPREDTDALGADGRRQMTREEREAFIRKLDALLEQDASSEARAGSTVPGE